MPTPESAKLALRTQQIIAYESGVPNVVDPLAGSYYVESLTNELIERAQELIEEVDALGGSVAAIESGWIQGRIADSAYRAQEAIENKETTVVAVNRFAPREGAPVDIELQRVDPKIEHNQTERVRRLRRDRDATAVQQCLASVREAAKSRDNLMPHFIEAVDAGATLGEVCNVLREEYGVYTAGAVPA